MGITVVGSERSASGQLTGEVIVGPFTMEDGDLFVTAIMQDKPAGVIGPGGGGAPSFTPAAAFTELQSIHVSGGGAFMWLGYRFWHTGDPEFSSFFVTPNGSDYVAIEAAIVFRGVDPAVPPDAAFLAMDEHSGQFESPSFVGTPFPDRKALVISGGMMYGDTGLSWSDQPPITIGVRFNIATGGNGGWGGKVLELAADFGQPAAGSYDHRYITRIAVPALGNPTMDKEAFGAVFYSFAEPVAPEPPSPDNLVVGTQRGRLYKVPT